MSPLTIWKQLFGPGERWAVAGALTFSWANLLWRYSATGLDPLVATAIRSLPIFILAFALTLINGTWRQLRPDSPGFVGWRPIGYAALGGLVNFVIGNPLQTRAFQLGGLVIAVPVVQTQVLWGAVLGAIFLREKLNRRMVLGIMVFMAGVAFLSAGQAGHLAVSPSWALAVPMSAMVGFFWAVGNVVTRVALTRGLSQSNNLAISNAVGVVGLTLILAALGRPGAYAAVPAYRWLWLVASGIAGGAGIGFFFTALSKTTVASATTIHSSNTGLSAIFAWLWLGEPLNLMMLTGIAAILGGVLMVQAGRPKGSPAAEAPMTEDVQPRAAAACPARPRSR